MLHRTLKIIWLIGFCYSCVNNQIAESDIPYFDAYMEYDATNKPQNTLLLKSDSKDFYYAISAVNVDSDVALNTVLPIAEETTFRFEEEGEYTITVRVFLPDGTYYAEKKLTWIYDEDLQMAPVVGFSESATNDQYVDLLISGNKSPNTVEIWIEGDLHPDFAPEGSWRVIPPTSLLPLQVSDGDGFKKFTVKTRNKAEVESEVLNLTILRKDKKPEECLSYMPEITKTRFIQFELTADDSRQLYYRVFGDTNNDVHFREFSGSDQIDLELTEGFGEKNITVQIRDEADNYCLKDDYTILYDPEYLPGSIQIKNNPIWTDEANIFVTVKQDHLPSDQMEIYLFGGIESSENTDQWIPYTEDEIAVRLTPKEGHRWVRAKFRKNGVELPMVWDGVYLKPYVYMSNNGGIYRLNLSNIIEIAEITVVGCSEDYTSIPFTTNLDCTPTGSIVDVEYVFTDGTSIIRSVSVPSS